MRILAVLAMVLILGACSTINGRTTQWIEIDTLDVVDADCHLETPKHKYRIITPGRERIEKTRHEMTITCTHDGYHDQVMTIMPLKDEVNLKKNIVTGYTGFAVDFATNAMYVYPERVEISMIAKDDIVVRDQAEMRGSNKTPLRKDDGSSYSKEYIEGLFKDGLQK